MNYWLFTVTQQKDGAKNYSPEQIFAQRMQDKFWGIGENTPNRKQLRTGDRIVYYLGSPNKELGGTAVLASGCIELSNEEQAEFGHGEEFWTQKYGVRLDQVEIWENRKSIESLVPQLSFIENKEFWYAYFQGGVRQIPEQDFQRITGHTDQSLVQQIITAEDIQSQHEFALEVHLEEFIHKNWSQIDWKRALELYVTDGQGGRQFPAGPWSIDFLAIDKHKNTLVVIELKRGKTSDATVGQLLRYMGWVKENIAVQGQNVEGMIIANEIDMALEYAVKGRSDIQVKRYRVDFRLI